MRRKLMTGLRTRRRWHELCVVNWDVLFEMVDLNGKAGARA